MKKNSGCKCTDSISCLRRGGPVAAKFTCVEIHERMATSSLWWAVNINICFSFAYVSVSRLLNGIFVISSEFRITLILRNLKSVQNFMSKSIFKVGHFIFWGSKSISKVNQVNSHSSEQGFTK